MPAYWRLFGWAEQQSLDELTYRRSGLFIALGVIILVLIALAIKIRSLP